jgi:hypothetical protein
MDLILNAISETQEPEIKPTKFSLVPQTQTILTPLRPQRIARSDLLPQLKRREQREIVWKKNQGT